LGGAARSSPDGAFLSALARCWRYWRRGGRFVALPASWPLLQFAGTHGMQ